mgnify:FL=1
MYYYDIQGTKIILFSNLHTWVPVKKITLSLKISREGIMYLLQLDIGVIRIVIRKFDGKPCIVSNEGLYLNFS